MRDMPLRDQEFDKLLRKLNEDTHCLPKVARTLQTGDSAGELQLPSGTFRRRQSMKTALAVILFLFGVPAFAQDMNSRAPYVFQTADGRSAIAIDTSAAPELEDWAEHTLAPVLAVWYPKIAAALPSPGFIAPQAYSITIKPMDGVGYTSGTKVFMSEKWIQGEMNGEAIGSIVHESVHVIQQYHSATPSWLVEGIADYLRWFKFEPQSHGADVVWMGTLHIPEECSIVVPCTNGQFSPRYDTSYRVSANFLNWVSGNYDSNLVTALNADLRRGKYTRDFWKRHTGKTVRELEQEWKQQLEAQLHPADAAGRPRN